MQQARQLKRHRDADRRANRQQTGLTRTSVLQQWVCQLCVFAMLSPGFVQVSQAGVISTFEVQRADDLAGRTAALEQMLARADVAAELARYGVSTQDVMTRVAKLTDEEILSLQNRIDEQVAGGDALAVIGVVFLVLLILEVVGVTDIFKSV